MKLTYGRVLARADITYATQVTLSAQWVWAGRAVADWPAVIDAARALQQALVGKRRTLTTTRNELDATQADLRGRMRQGLDMARSKYRREDPVAHQTLRLLRSGGRSRSRIMDEAVAWYEAWGLLPDADWSPTAQNTRAAFLTLLQEAQTKLQALAAAEAEEERAQQQLAGGLEDLHQDCVEWYEDACAVFTADTPEGRQVRSILVREAAADDEEDDEAPQPPPA